MNSPRKHHFVPQMLLRQFIDERGHLHFFDRRLPEKGVLTTSPQKLFTKRDLYAVDLDDGSKNYEIEKMLGSLENEAAPIMQKIITAARAGEPAKLTDVEKATLDCFQWLQWKRVPDVHDRYFPEAEYEALLDKLVEEFNASVRPMTDEERIRISSRDTRLRIRQRARALSMSLPNLEVMNILAGKGLLVALISRPNRSFLIGSHPVVKLTCRERKHLADPSVELWLPIASDVAIAQMPEAGKVALVEVTDDRSIRLINESIYLQSTIIAGCSRRLVASVARTGRHK